ncbi:MAG TPA: hypothetical protein VL595_32655 [Pseudonocardia sp.]|jgi:hypothetical protein|nr:hypothetical protein [Pseudonocardia sp.]
MRFETAEEFCETLGAFLAGIMDDPKVAKSFHATKSLVRIDFSEPDVVMWMDCRLPRPVVTSTPDTGTEASETPDMVLVMSADNGHKLWLGRLSLPVALTSRQVVVKGPTNKLMRLLPALRPIYRRYEQFLAEHGRNDLLAA